MAEHMILSTDRMKVRSLAWSGDALIDWVTGGTRFGLDGSIRMSSVMYAYRFDAAIASRDSDFAVVYERTGTRGLVLRKGKILREINRSFYQAHVYEYPVCLWTGNDGRTLIAHCPDEYNRIEIDDAETGERLTESSERTPTDFFHSRLHVSPGGTRLLSAGWMWTPLDCVEFFDLVRVQHDPGCLDRSDVGRSWGDDAGLVEDIAACWQTDDRIIIAGGGEEDPSEEDENQDDTLRLHPNGIVVFDIPDDLCVRSIVLPRPAGTMMPVGDEQVVAFYEHPRLISLVDGRVIKEWPNIPSGNQVSSITGDYAPPPLALDPANRRFAVAHGEEIHVVTV